MRNNSSRIFHLLIIAFLALSFSGCGYKAAPTYVDETQQTKEAK